MNKTSKSPKNKTIELSADEEPRLTERLLSLTSLPDPLSGVYNGDFRDLLPFIPKNSVNLLILDPPYNLAKDFNGFKFSRMAVDEYTQYLDELIASLLPILNERATVYICGDWFSSASIFAAASKHLFVRNRISWEREKGRGAKSNWKNASEDIWFCTRSDTYVFNLEAVKLRRKVLAPYKDSTGTPKDWSRKSKQDPAFRDTHPSNFWSDITVPFWSMAENTQHPTQKSEKLIAKLILASSKEGDLIFDPFMGSGTSCVVAQKLGRRFLACDIDKTYCLLAEKRLEIALQDPRIQGLFQGVFWERNSLAQQARQGDDR